MRWGTYEGDRVRLDPASFVLLVLVVAAVVVFGSLFASRPVPDQVVSPVGDEFVTGSTVQTSVTPTASTIAAPVPPRADGPVGSVTQTATRGTAAPVGTFPPVPTGAPLWAGPIPRYGDRGVCTVEQATVITHAFAAVGASFETQVWSLWIASRESGCDTSAHNRNEATRDDSYGVCQLNARSGHFGPAGVLAGWARDRLLIALEYAAQACAELWRVCGRGPWQPPYSCTTPPELR